MPHEHEQVFKIAPQGAVLQRTRRNRFWRDYIFLIEKKPSRISGLKLGDTFIVSAPTKFTARHF
jgi:hypothetical protein